MTTTVTLARSRIDSLRKPEGIKITDEIRRSFPAVFASAPSPKMTDSYQFYPTDRLIEDMDAAGMKLVQIGQQSSIKRDPSHQLHVVRFQPKGDASLPSMKVGDSKMELVILNSHNGRNRFQAYAGVFRLVCLNGMVIADNDMGKIRTKHIGVANSYDVIKELIDGMASRVGTIGSRIDAWSALQLDPAQQIALARAAMGVRKFPEWLDPEQLIEARREGEDVGKDGKRDLWTTFNVLQENVIKGGVDKTGAGRPSATRPITGAFNDVKVNADLWAVVEDFAGKIMPVHEPEVEAAQDRDPRAQLEADAKDGVRPGETADDVRRRKDRARKALKRAEAQTAA